MSNGRWLAAAFADNRLVEVRCLSAAKYTWAGLYDDQDALVRDVRQVNDGRFKGIYALLNRPLPVKATNRLTPAIHTTRNQDIARITRLPFDFDPARHEPNSDDAELAEAHEQAQRLVNVLGARGFPEPLIAMSGNGWHVQYRVDLPADGETVRLLRAIYAGLKDRFDTPEVGFDTSVRNPARIFRLYGTTARKGEHTEDRPQRVTRCWTPKDWQRVDLDVLEELAREVTPKRRTAVPRPATGVSGDYATLDVVGWLRSHGHYLRPLSDGKHAVICPWQGEHSEDHGEMDTSTAVGEKSGGWPWFKCLHAHCEHRTLMDVIAFFGDAGRYCGREWRA